MRLHEGLLEGQEVAHVREVLVGGFHPLSDERAHLRPVWVLDGVEESARPADARQYRHVSRVALRHHHVAGGAHGDVGSEHGRQQVELGALF